MKNNSAQIKIIFVSLLLVAGVSTAGTTDNVTATVTAASVSVTVSDGVVTYGTLALSSTQDTAVGNLNDSQDAANSGNVTEDFNVAGQNSASWTLDSSIGISHYIHDWCTSDCDGTPTWNPLTVGYQQMTNAIAAGNTQNFDLRLSTPSSTTDYTQQSVDVTVQAVQD